MFHSPSQINCKELHSHIEDHDQVKAEVPIMLKEHSKGHIREAKRFYCKGDHLYLQIN